MRLELAHLTRDAERQRREERRAIECGQLSRQVERTVASASAGQHAELELRTDCVPFASKAWRQRQLDAPRDEEDPRLHVWAARRSVSSSSPSTRSGA